MRKIILSTMLFLTPYFALATITDLELPLEMNSFQIEFRDISKAGTIRVEGCKKCIKEIYEFDDSVIVQRSGKVITIKELLNEYWKAQYPTIFLEINSDTVVRISY